MSAVFRQATEDDGDAILHLFRSTPQRGRVMLNFEREPDYFCGSKVICDQPESWIVRRDQGAVQMLFGFGQRTLYVNGAARPVRYAHDLRLAEDSRGGRMILRMARHVGERVSPDELIQTVILSDNSVSMNSVASGRAGLPVYYPCGDIETSLLFAPAGRNHPDIIVRNATADDVPAMQALHDELAPGRQFYPCYSFSKMLNGDSYYSGLSVSDYWLAFRGDQLIGMSALWNQKHFKQTRVLAYPRGLSWVRYLWNIWAALFGGVRLPEAGGQMNYLTLHSTLIRDDDSRVLDALLGQMLDRRAQKSHAIAAGFFIQDPLRKALQGYRRQIMSSQHFLIGYHGDPRQGLDARLPYIEIARL